MLPFVLRKKKEDEEFFAETDDVIVIFDRDNRTSIIERISEIRENCIYVTGKHAVPLEDAVISNGVEGRIFYLNAPTEYITETRRLAALEKSMVLSQVTAYKTPQPPGSMDWTKASLFGLVALAILVFGFTACGAG